MNISKKLVYGLVFLEIQIIVISLIFLIPKVLEVEQKVERTNKFLFTAIQDKNIASLQTIHHDDIVIGDKDAPATMYLYTRFNCSACSDFYSDNYERLQQDYVEKGLLKIVVRYLTHIDDKPAFFAARCARYAYDNDAFMAYNKVMVSNHSDLNLSIIEENTLSILPDSAKLVSYLNSDADGKAIYEKAKTARAAGVSRTPSIIINGQLLVGNRKYQKLEQLIREEING